MRPQERKPFLALSQKDWDKAAAPEPNSVEERKVMRGCPRRDFFLGALLGESLKSQP